MGAAFGSGASGSLFGASGSANFLSRTTAVLAGVFFVCTLALAYFGHSVPRAGLGQRARPCRRGAGAGPASGPAAQIPGATSVPPARPAARRPAVPAVPASGAGQIPTR
jgi:preprotein translocase subunit SecG